MNIHLRNSGKLAISAGLLVIVITLQVFFYQRQNVDPYAFSSIGNAQEILSNGRYQLYPFSQASSSWQEHANGISERPAPSLLLVTLSLVMGLSVWDIAFLPINGLIFLLIFFVFARNFSKSGLAATVCIIIMSLDAMINETTSNVYYISYGFTLVMLFLLIYEISLRAKSHNRIYVAMSILVFVTAYFSYYTAEFVMIGFVMCFSLVSFGLRDPRRKSLNMPLIFLFIFIAFDTVFNSYIAWGPWNKGPAYFESIVRYFIGFIFRGSSAVEERGHFTGSMASVYLEFILRALILVPLAAYLIYSSMSKLKSMRNGQSLRLSVRGTMFASLILVVGLGMLVYMNLGVVDYRWFYVFFPLLAVVSVQHMGQHLAARRNNWKLLALVLIFSLLLVLVATARFLVGSHSSISSRSGFDAMMPSTSWIAEYSDNVSVVTNFHTAGMLFFSTVQAERSNSVTVYFSQFAQIADFLATANMSGTRDYLDKKGYECVLIPTEMQYSATSIGAWAIVGRVQPLGASTFEFDNFLIFNKIYDDGQEMLYDHNMS